MAGTWNGFTEEDIKSLNHSPDSTENPKLKSIKQGKRLKTYHTDIRKSKPDPQTTNLIPDGASLKTHQPEVQLKSEPQDTTTVQDNHNAPVPTETLEQFHDKQKLLEEQNRQRKDFLAKVLSDRKRQTTQEAKRLQQIQDELHKLDVLLGDDVAILRDQIEIASKEFAEAQKRFNRAEKEFLDSKQHLFAKMERKELLTKHLCTIIEQNELRKAQKLSELMGKLSIDTCLPNMGVINECGPVDNNSSQLQQTEERQKEIT